MVFIVKNLNYQLKDETKIDNFFISDLISTDWNWLDWEEMENFVVQKINNYSMSDWNILHFSNYTWYWKFASDIYSIILWYLRRLTFKDNTQRKDNVKWLNFSNLCYLDKEKYNIHWDWYQAYENIFQQIQNEVEELNKQNIRVFLMFDWQFLFNMFLSKYLLRNWNSKLFHKEQNIFDILSLWFEHLNYICNFNWNKNYNSYYVNIKNTENYWKYLEIFDWNIIQSQENFKEKYLNNFSMHILNWTFWKDQDVLKVLEHKTENIQK